MRITPVAAHEAPNRNTYRKSENQRLAEEFIASGAECVKVDGWKHKTAVIAAGTLATSFRRYGYHQIKVVRRDDEIYLVKKEV